MKKFLCCLMGLSAFFVCEPVMAHCINMGGVILCTGYTFEPFFTTNGPTRTIMYGSPTQEMSFQLQYTYDPFYNNFFIEPVSFSGDSQYVQYLSTVYDNITLKYMFENGWSLEVPFSVDESFIVTDGILTQQEILTNLENQYVAYLISHPSDNIAHISEILDGLIFNDDIVLVRDAYGEYVFGLPETQQSKNAVISARHMLRQQNINLINMVFDRLGTFGNHTNNKSRKFDVWGQTTYNYSRLSHSKNDFISNAFGLVLGADLQLGSGLTLGGGYNYNTSVIITGQPDLDMINHTAFLYAQYHPKDFILDTMFAYNLGSYKDELTDTSGDMNGFVGAIMAGVNTDSGLIPEFGLRYSKIIIEPDNENIKKYDSDILTYVSGLEYAYALERDGLKLKSHLFFTYDIQHADSDIDFIVPIINYTYTINDTMMPLGVEGGLNLEMPFNGWVFSAGYDVTLRTHYVNHAGMVRAKYEF